jgi:hypothetical protein
MTIIETLGTQSIFLYELYFTYSFLTYKNQFSLIMVVTILTNIVINLILKNYIMEWGKSHSYPVDMRATLSGKSHSYTDAQEKTHNHYIPIFGSLCRPIDKKCDKIENIGYGTPSNHSQISSFIAAFYYFYYKNTEEYSKITMIVLTALAIMIMTTRYTSKMHSIPQIMLGSLLGIFLAYVLNGVIRFFI